MIYNKWSSLDREGKKERVILISIMVALLSFSPIWNHFEQKQLNEKIEKQQKTLIEDIKDVVAPISQLPKDLEELKKGVEDIEQKIQEDKTIERDGDSLDTEVVNKNNTAK